MARFVPVKDRLFNLDNIDYVTLAEEEDRKIKIYFNGSSTLELGGDEAEQFGEYLRELDVVDRLPFFS